MDFNFGEDLNSTQAKSVRFHHHNHNNYNHEHSADHVHKNSGSSNSLSLLIPQVDVGSPVSPIISARSPRVNQILHTKNVTGYASEGDLPQASINDANEDWNFHSYHLDYKHTPPLVKGPCCVCGDGIIGAMVTALDKMWHPEHFRCVNCNLELIGPNYLEHDGRPYCKSCHNILFLPPCSGCKKDIAGQYVTALNKIWHPECFTCTTCNRMLSPTNFFTKDGKPYCEDDYHKLFSPKCHACKKPIKDDKKVEIGGRQWHREHFKCCECGIQLTPKNFREKNGKLYCENDYNDLFKPKCADCNKPILQEPISAMNNEWHPQCFKCTECKKPLSPNKFHEKNGKPYCEDDFHRLFSPKCAGCDQPIKNKNQMVQAQGKNWHPEHFCCFECRKQLDPKRFFEKNGNPYCEDDFHKLFSPKCPGCLHPIKDPTNMVKAQGKFWHPEHFCCTKCRKTLDPNRFFEKNGQPYCEDDFHKLFSPKCAGCGDPIKDASKAVHAQGKIWHPDHFCCTVCRKPLQPNHFFERDGLAYCEDDFHNLFSPRCAGCGNPIRNKYVFALGKHWHPEHFKCNACGRSLDENNFYEKDGVAYCVEDFMNLFAPRCSSCNKPITSDYCIVALGSDWHPNCFKCKDCNVLLEHQDFYEYEGEPFCETHYHARMCPDCMKLRRAENRYWGIKDDRVARPNSSLYVMATDFDTTSGDSRPGSRLSEVSSGKLYDYKSQDENNWKEVRPIPIISTQSTCESYSSNQSQGQSHNHGQGHGSELQSLQHHYHDDGISCGENHFEKKILIDANSHRQRNTSGNSRNSNMSTSTITGPLPIVPLNALKSNHQHKHEQYFETGTMPGKFPTFSNMDNMKFQTMVTKEEFQTVTRNY